MFFADWNRTCLPKGIRWPWNVFQEVLEWRIANPSEQDTVSSTQAQDEFRQIQTSDALQMFGKLPAMRQCSYVDISIEELSSFVAWSAKSKFDDVQKLYDASDSLNACEKCEHITEKPVDVLAVDRFLKSVATHSMLLRAMQTTKRAQEEKSIEVVGQTGINNDSYCFGLTDHIIDGD